MSEQIHIMVAGSAEVSPDTVSDGEGRSTSCAVRTGTSLASPARSRDAARLPGVNVETGALERAVTESAPYGRYA